MGFAEAAVRKRTIGKNGGRVGNRDEGSLGDISSCGILRGLINLGK